MKKFIQALGSGILAGVALFGPALLAVWLKAF